MLRKDINLSEVLEYYKRNKIASFDEEIDQYGGYFITAGRIAAIILAPTPLLAIANFCAGIDAASLRASKLLSWLPDKFKYKDRGREKFAVDRYELANVINFMILHIAIKNGVKEIIMPVITTILENVQLEEEDKKQLTKISEECERESTVISVPSNCLLSKDDVSSHAFKIVDPILGNLFKLADKCKEEKSKLKKIDLQKTKDKYVELVSLYYNAFVINFSGEFPEFKVWADVTQSGKIIKELAEVAKGLNAVEKRLNTQFIKRYQQLTQEIEKLRKPDFIPESGFPSFQGLYKESFELQTKKIVGSLSSKIKESVEAHHNKIKDEINKPLIDNADIEGIVYPKNKEIYIAQSFRSIDYTKKTHKRDFLTNETMNGLSTKGENISSFLLQSLIDPNYSNKPIVLLGLPGAGKSMLSKMFAGQLCETNDFIPFLVKLRNVASNTANVSEHINKGISKSPDTNWIEWAKEFRDRIPVIIMDGFDELMQSSTTELNNYIGAIKEFQNDALHHDIAVRIILTSRTTVMQNVYIPEGTRIIKLDSFDAKRRDLWVKIWNSHQIKAKYKFSIPQNSKIEHLAQEPLLIFMLAVYDFEKSELQLMTMEKNFNQSKLYDSLLISFIDRQLKKNDYFKNLNEEQQKKERELFRLRLGMIALLMFLNNTAHKDTQKLKEELEVFGLHESHIQSKNVLGDFFFIHDNKSTTEGDSENLNFEFLHKTFGEFLAADFLLRIAFKQTQKSREKVYQQYIFKFCFGYNWLNKHENIQNFLFEYATQYKSENKEIIHIIDDIIKPDLESLFKNGNLDFPVKENQILPHKEVVEHLAIYSQNLIFLWLAISNDSDVRFEIFGSDEKIGDVMSEPKYESQDRDETNKNKLLWKRLAKLWTMVGNHSATAKLSDWIKIVELDNSIHLLKSKSKSKVSHNFSDSAKVACNHFELLLSFFDNEFKFSEEAHTLTFIEKITKKKPELNSLAIDSVLHRFHDLFEIENIKLLEWFKGKDLSRRQQISLMRKIASLKWLIAPDALADILRFVAQDLFFSFRENFQASIEYLKVLVDLKTYFPLNRILDPELLDEVFRGFSKDMVHYGGENPLATLEYFKLLNELNRHYPFRRKIKGEFFEESFHIIIKDMHRFLRNSPYSSFEYLKLLTEMQKYYPVGKRFQPEFYEEAIHRVSKDIQFIARENPSVILEFLKLIYDLRKHFPIREILPDEFFEELLKHLSDEWSAILDDDRFNLVEYLKFIIELKRYYPIEKLIPIRLLEESYDRVAHDLTYLIRENPRQANEYFNLMKDIYRLWPREEFMPYKRSRMFDETLHRLSKDIDIDFRGNPTSILIYLEILLMNRFNYRENEEEHDIERLVEVLSKNKFGNSIVKKASFLLMRYEAAPRLIHMLLHQHPKIHSIYLNSPELARDIIEAMKELESNERNS